MRHTVISIVFAVAILSLGVSGPTHADDAAPPASVKDLAWMSGHWEGAVEDGFLEENWTQPQSGSIASLVRRRQEGATTFIEMIIVNEERGSLVLRLQQWNPDYQPRSAAPQVMKLVELDKNKVVFAATGPGFLRKLTYTREHQQFFIFAVTDQGPVKIQLSGK
jgi:hypothetical protein